MMFGFSFNDLAAHPAISPELVASEIGGSWGYNGI